jgi:hypothetical protein
MAKRISKGFGDTVAKFTEATGIDKAVKFIAGKDCGCDKRKEVLNKLFPYKTPECLTEVEYEHLTFLLPKFKKTDEARPSEQLLFLQIYNRVFKTNERPTSCGGCLNQLIKNIKQVYDSYEGQGGFLG